MKKIVCLLVILSVGACNNIPKEAYNSRGGPESLLDITTERVDVALNSQGAIAEINEWIEQDKPSRAEVLCLDSSKLCKKAKKLLNKADVPVEHDSVASNKVVLVYERVAVRDCDSSFMTNHINPYNFNHPTYGCSIGLNMVQMISDKTQITDPVLLGLPDAAPAIKRLEGIDGSSVNEQ